MDRNVGKGNKGEEERLGGSEGKRRGGEGRGGETERRGGFLGDAGSENAGRRPRVPASSHKLCSNRRSIKSCRNYWSVFKFITFNGNYFLALPDYGERAILKQKTDSYHPEQDRKQ